MKFTLQIGRYYGSFVLCY